MGRPGGARCRTQATVTPRLRRRGDAIQLMGQVVIHSSRKSSRNRVSDPGEPGGTAAVGRRAGRCGEVNVDTCTATLCRESGRQQMGLDLGRGRTAQIAPQLSGSDLVFGVGNGHRGDVRRDPAPLVRSIFMSGTKGSRR